MASIPAFISPRCDLTIRSVPPDKIDAICNMVCDILGGRVEYTTTAIYESEQTPTVEPRTLSCPKLFRHPKHRWFHWVDDDNELVVCPGLEDLG